MNPALSSGVRSPLPLTSLARTCLTGVVAAYLLFVLPYSFPPQVRIASASYAFGFGNRAGILAFAALVWALAAAYAWRAGQTRGPALTYKPLNVIHSCDRAVVLLFAGICICYLALTVVIFLAVAKSSGYYKIDFEASHFLWRLKLMAAYGLRPYLDFVCEHGPAFVYGPAWAYSALGRFGVSTEGAYYVYHGVLDVFGLWVLLRIVNSLVMPARAKLIAFSLIAIPAFSPSMGLNGLLIRTLLPFWSLLVVHRAASVARPNAPSYRTPALVAVLTVANVSISPEIGIACIVTLAGYALCLLPIDRLAALQILASELVIAVISALVLPAEYFHTFLSVSQGGNNYPIVPALHILLYATLFLVCVPRLLAARFSQATREASYACAQGVLILACAPGALSRCDFPHVIQYGFPLFLIAFSMFSQQSRRALWVYIFAYTLVAILLFEWSNARYYGLSFAKLAVGTQRILATFHIGPGHADKPVVVNSHSSSSPPVSASSIGLTPKPFDLASFDRYPALGLPYGSYGYDRALQNHLWQEKKVAPQRYMGALAVYNEPQLRDALADVSGIRYIIVQQNFLRLQDFRSDPCTGSVEDLKWSLLYPFAPTCVREPLDPNLEIANFIAGHYRPVEQIGDYVILERNQ
jgi:hypothetical protein